MLPLSSVLRSINRLFFYDHVSHFRTSNFVRMVSEKSKKESATTSNDKTELDQQSTTNAKKERAAGFADRRARTLFIWNIPMRFGENELYMLFSKYGRVKQIRKFVDKNGNILKYGFCEFHDKECAEKAREQLNGYEIYDQKLEVKYRRPEN